MSLVCVYMRIIVFFFKQKTAYEMRISDWSSDVCSSDLNPVDLGLRCLFPGAIPPGVIVWFGRAARGITFRSPAPLPAPADTAPVPTASRFLRMRDRKIVV